MDAAYDHIQEQSFPDDEDPNRKNTAQSPQHPTLNADIQEAYKAFSNSPWGARIGGFFGTVVKQGESVYREAQQELTTVGQEATRGWTDLRETIVQRTRSLSLVTTPGPDQTARSADDDDEEDKETTPTKTMTSDEALKESETVLSRLRTEAAKRLKDIQKAEEAADEALLKFGSNIRDFLKDAITIAPPSGSDSQNNTVLFESKDAQGKRVIHTSRFDAQMHVIHTSVEGFMKDPTSDEFMSWSEKFDVEGKTDEISGDLSKYPELRATMEKVVPDQVSYADFWKRYYFLRHGIETAEARRKDLLKAASAEEEVGWDEDSEDSDDSDDSDAEAGPSKPKTERPSSRGSSTTIHAAPVAKPATNLKSSEPRKSNDEASDTSYDMVGAASGNPSKAPSQAPSSPKKNDDDDDDSDDDEEDDSDDDDDDDDDSEEDWE